MIIKLKNNKFCVFHFSKYTLKQLLKINLAFIMKLVYNYKGYKFITDHGVPLLFIINRNEHWQKERENNESTIN